MTRSILGWILGTGNKASFDADNAIDQQLDDEHGPTRSWRTRAGHLMLKTDEHGAINAEPIIMDPLTQHNAGTENDDQ